MQIMKKVIACFAISLISISMAYSVDYNQLKKELNDIAQELDNKLTEWKVPSRVFKVEKYGAKGDARQLNTQAVQKAIDECARKGGGTVLFSKGEYVTGTIVLRSGVMLEIKEGAKILGSTDIKDYPPMIEEFKSVMSENYMFTQSLIYAEKAKNIGICGKGEIYFRGEKKNFSSPQTIGPIKDRPVGIRMIQCENIVLKDIFLHNSASWMQNYLYCNNLLFDGIKVVNQANFNNDGLDPDGCTNVIVRNCYINSEDDAMCLKGCSGKPTENVLIENSTFISTCNAFKVGTDTQGDFRKVIVRNVVLGGVPFTEETIAGNESSTGITIASVDGGTVENFYFDNITINQARCPIFIRIGDRGRVMPGTEKPAVGKVRNIFIENVKGENNYKQGSFISGIQGHPVENIKIKDYNITVSGGGTADMIIQTVGENEAGYPDAHQFSKKGLPSYGFYFRHAKDIIIENAEVIVSNTDERPVIYNGGDVSNTRYNDLYIK